MTFYFVVNLLMTFYFVVNPLMTFLLCGKSTNHHFVNDQGHKNPSTTQTALHNTGINIQLRFNLRHHNYNLYDFMTNLPLNWIVSCPLGPDHPLLLSRVSNFKDVLLRSPPLAPKGAKTNRLSTIV